MDLPKDFLAKPAPAITVSRIDFPSYRLPLYRGLYAVVLDNVLNPEECAQLIQAAELSTAQGWQRALINVGNGEQADLPRQRNCERIVWKSEEIVRKIWARIVDIPEVKEIKRLENVPHIVGKGPTKRQEVWKFSRPNENMRFLKYSPGHYFRPHIDGSYETPDHQERAYFTLHLYLNSAITISPEEGDLVEYTEGERAFVGGATLFHSYGETKDGGLSLAIKPQAGRILLFQHRDLLHSGEDVIQGIKYTMRAELMYSLESTKASDRSKLPVLENDYQ